LAGWEGGDLLIKPKKVEFKPVLEGEKLRWIGANINDSVEYQEEKY